MSKRFFKLLIVLFAVLITSAFLMACSGENASDSSLGNTVSENSEPGSISADAESESDVSENTEHGNASDDIESETAVSDNIAAEDVSENTAAGSDIDNNRKTEYIIENPENDTLVISSSEVMDSLKGCTIGVITGTITEDIINDTLENVNVVHYSSAPDIGKALDVGKIDAFASDLPIAGSVVDSYDDQNYYACLSLEEYGFIFPKDDPKADVLIAQVNEYLKNIQENGELEELQSIWFGKNSSLKVVDYSGLTGENGTLNFGISTSLGDPIAYVKNGKYAGFEVALATAFCREYGYDIDVFDADFSGLLSFVATGKCDFGGSCITISGERKENMDFSNPIYSSGTVVVVKDDFFGITSDAKEDEGSQTGFWENIKTSIYNTFIKEDRWKLFASGLGTTFIITICSMVAGSALGFLLYLLYRKNKKIINRIVNAISSILSKTPMILILMIFYYVLFANNSMDGIWVSVICFTLLFAFCVHEQLKDAVDSVDSIHTDVAIALGYTDVRGFLRCILPQSLNRFIMGYKSEVVNLIQTTSIVGFVAVQDLTKISDIIRSITFEAFASLIVSAIIYYAFSSLMIFVVNRIQIVFDPTKRSEEKILKGIKTR